jgi:hypothetical protein
VVGFFAHVFPTDLLAGQPAILPNGTASRKDKKGC